MLLIYADAFNLSSKTYSFSASYTLKSSGCGDLPQDPYMLFPRMELYVDSNEENRTYRLWD